MGKKLKKEMNIKRDCMLIFQKIFEILVGRGFFWKRLFTQTKKSANSVQPVYKYVLLNQ